MSLCWAAKSLEHPVLDAPDVIKRGGRAIIDTFGLCEDKIALGDRKVQMRNAFEKVYCNERVFWNRHLVKCCNDRFRYLDRIASKSPPHMQSNAASAKVGNPRSVLSAICESVRRATKVGNPPVRSFKPIIDRRSSIPGPSDFQRD